MSKERDRVLCVPLSQAEWEAFIARHPEPVDWLREQILSQIDSDQALPKPQSPLRRPTSPFSTHRV